MARIRYIDKSAFSFSIAALFNGVATAVHYAHIALFNTRRRPYLDFLDQRYGIAPSDTEPFSRLELDNAFEDTHSITIKSGAIYALSATCLSLGIGVLALGAIPFAPALAATFTHAAGGLASHATARTQTIAEHALWNMNFAKASRSVDALEQHEQQQEQQATIAVPAPDNLRKSRDFR